MKRFLSALLRALVAAGGPALILWILDSRLNPEQGPDIGGGFIFVLALFVIPLIWAWRDGRSYGSDRSFLIWGVAAALVFLTDVTRLVADGFKATDLGYVLFFASILTAPFLVGGVLGSLLGGASSRRRI